MLYFPSVMLWILLGKRIHTITNCIFLYWKLFPPSFIRLYVPKQIRKCDRSLTFHEANVPVFLVSQLNAKPFSPKCQEAVGETTPKSTGEYRPHASSEGTGQRSYCPCPWGTAIWWGRWGPVLVPQKAAKKIWRAGEALPQRYEVQALQWP